MREPHPSPDLLLQHLDWVRRLARSLARDEAAADDLVQDAWLRTQGATGRGRAWLARVVANLARDQRRGEARRVRREERAARPEAAPSDAELRDRVAGQDVLARWVLELEDPYRRTLLLRWLEGYEPDRIAALEEVPIATVRTRLRRGEARLRARAERETPGESRAWLVFLAGAPEASVVSHALASTSTPFLLLAMPIKFLAALALVSLVLWAVLRGPTQLREPGNAPIAAHDAAADSPKLARVADGVDAAVQSETTRTAVGATAVVDAPLSAPQTEVAQADLLVRVVDSAGRPFVGATVALFIGTGKGASLAESAVSEGSLAIARFPDFERILQRLPAGSSSLPRFIGLAMPGPGAVRTALPTSGLPSEQPVLIVPEHGSLRVRFVDTAGAPYRITTWAYLTDLSPRNDGTAVVDRGTRISTYARDADTLESTVLPVGVELLFEVGDVGIIRGVERRLEPLRAGEVRELEVVFGATHPHARGRIVAADGSDLGAYGFGVVFEPEGSARVYEVGPRGEFALPLDRLRSADDGRFRARIECTVGSPNERRLLTGAFEAVLPADGGAVDVGIIELRGAPIAAEGHVVDERGEPAEGVNIGMLSKTNQGADPEDFTYNFAAGYARTDADGHFLLEGEFPVGEYALRSFHGDWIDRGATRFQLGTRGIEIVVDRVHCLAGRVLLADGVDLSELLVRAHEAGASRERAAYWDIQAELQPDGSFLLQGLRPEPVTLTLVRRASTAALAALERIAPHIAPEDRPSALDPWDLRDDFVRVAVQVHRADGSPMERGLVAVGRHQLPHESGRVRALVPATWGDELLVVAPGHVPFCIPAREASRRIDLVRGHLVTLTSEAPLPAVPDGWTVDVSLDPETPTWVPAGGFISTQGYDARSLNQLWLEQVPVAAGTTSWQLAAPTPGAYRPLWRIEVPPTDLYSGSRSSPVSTQSGRYDIRIDAATHVPASELVAVDRARFESALESLAR